MALIIKTPPVLYNDIGKRASDLLTKDFPDKLKAEVKTTTPNGVGLEVSMTKSTTDDTIVGLIFPKYTFVKQGVTVGFSADTNKNTKFEASLTKLFPNLKLTTIVESKKPNTIQLEGEYKHDYVALNGAVSINNNAQTPQASIGGVVGYEGFSVGLQTKYHQNEKLSEVGGTVAYTASDYVFTLFGLFKSQQLGVSYFHRITPSASAGFEASFDLTPNPEKNPKLTVGGSYQLNPDTAIKGKLDTDGKLSLSYAQRYSRYLRGIVGTSFNINHVNTNKSGVSFGFTLSFND